MTAVTTDGARTGIEHSDSTGGSLFPVTATEFRTSTARTTGSVRSHGAAASVRREACVTKCHRRSRVHRE